MNSCECEYWFDNGRKGYCISREGCIDENETEEIGLTPDTLLFKEEVFRKYE